MSCPFQQFNEEFSQSNLLIKAFVVLGAFHLLYYITSITVFLFNLIRSPLNLLQRYGSKSWALVTGPTEGIGKSFCYSLSKRGFNVILVARNEQKAQGIVNDLQKKYPELKYRIVIADFSNNLKDEQFFTKISESVKEYDISLVVNNVGVEIERSDLLYHSSAAKDIINMITINTGVQSLLTSTLLPRLLSRSSKSAIIDLSSYGATFPIPFLEVYSATKAFNDFLTRGLSQEYKSKIDFLSLRPMIVESGATSQRIKEGIMKGHVSAEQCTESTLNQLGRAKKTFGHIFHTIQAELTHSLPNRLLSYILYSESKKIKLASMQKNKKVQ